MEENEVKNRILELVREIYFKGPSAYDVLSELSYFKYAYPTIFSEFELQIIKYMGLFYKNINYDDLENDIPFKLFDDSIFDLFNKHLTPMQADIKSYMLEKRYFMFSAPTSSGKSYLLKDLILTANNDIAIIVPTRALLNEYIRDIQKELYDKNIRDYNILPFVEKINTKYVKHNIFVLTPERAFEIFNNKVDIDLFIFDEAQILDFNQNVRSLKYRVLLKKIESNYPDSKKLFAYPFVENLSQVQEKLYPEDKEVNYKYYNYQNIGQMLVYKTTASKFHVFDKSGHNLYKLEGDPIVNVLSQNNPGKVLIYCSKSKIINGRIYDIVKDYIHLCKSVEDSEALSIIKQVKEKIGSTNEITSKLIEYMMKGVVIHHGALPHSIRFLIEKFINLGHAQICIATTTLEQGVNMPFNIVYLYEMVNLNGALDLKNLIGRAGRSTIDPTFDYGMVITRNKETFLSKLKENANVDLRDDINIGEDFEDLQKALEEDNINEEINIPNSLIDKMDNTDVLNSMQIILDLLYESENIPDKGAQFEKFRDSFENIYRYQLKDKRDLVSAEKSIFTTAIRILLWKFQKKKFSEIVMRRYVYYKKKGFNGARFMQIPNKNMIYSNMFSGVEEEYYYDIVVYNTFEFIDKCINLYLKDNFIAASYLYIKSNPDSINAEKFYNFLKYGSDTYEEIMLFRYGFVDDEIEDVLPCIDQISDREIVFNEGINSLSEELKEKCKYYIYDTSK